MPSPYTTPDEKDPTAHLHYFFNGWDWWIIEKDIEEQEQVFGFVKSDLCPEGELGYILVKRFLAREKLDYADAVWLRRAVRQLRADRIR